MPPAIRPLPVRVDPALGESWAGYTQRVATFYGVTWRTLVRHTLLGGSGACPSPLVLSLLERIEGVAITNQTATGLARHFRLTRNQVLDMHLTRFDGSALTIDDRIRREFDPYCQSWRGATSTSSAPYGPRVGQRPVPRARLRSSATDWAATAALLGLPSLRARGWTRHSFSSAHGPDLKGQLIGAAHALARRLAEQPGSSTWGGPPGAYWQRPHDLHERAGARLPQTRTHGGDPNN